MIARIRPSQLADWLAQAGPNPVVLDVREPSELQTASVVAKGFALLAIPMNTVPAQLHTLETNQPIACLCHHGVRSMHVAQFLASQGFTRLANIEGGIDAWSQELDANVPRY
jgi:rhodanese-related sulfurtransferase